MANQELRSCAADTACARAQVPWLRDRLLKLGVQVVCFVRRFVLLLPRATPEPLEISRAIVLPPVPAPRQQDSHKSTAFHR